MDFVFTQDPGSADLRLVEVEQDGRSIQLGTWSDRDGYRVLTVTAQDFHTATGPRVDEPRAADRIAHLVHLYIADTPGARQAYQTVPEYHASVQQLTRLLSMVDEAMAAEGVPADMRLRVVNTVVFGDPAGAEASRRAAEARYAEMQNQIKAILSSPTTELYPR